MGAKRKLTFAEMLERARQEIPPAPDLRLAIRQRLEAAPEFAPVEWFQIVIEWARPRPTRAVFLFTFALLLFTSYWELSRPAPTTTPPMPTFLIDQLFPQ